MKPFKMLGLAALAALMAMAFVGAGSAMAERTVLCENDSESSCTEITHVHETSVGKAILLASPKVECLVLFLGEVEEGGAGQAVVVGNFTYSSCTSGCKVEEETEGGEKSSVIEVEKEGHETGKVVGEGEVHVNCIGINCYYNGKGLAGTAKGLLLASKTIDTIEEKEINLTENGEVSVQEQTVHKVKGTFCPETGKLDIKTTPLVGTHIKTMLCEPKANGLYEHQSNAETCGDHNTGAGSWELYWL